MLQFHRRHPFIADAMGIALVAATLGLMMLFRAVYVEPREWGAICVAVDPPLSCIPRNITLWMQGWYGWGAAALYAGLLTLIRSPSGPSTFLSSAPSRRSSGGHPRRTFSAGSSRPRAATSP